LKSKQTNPKNKVAKLKNHMCRCIWNSLEVLDLHFGKVKKKPKFWSLQNSTAICTSAYGNAWKWHSSKALNYEKKSKKS
jgi:hypothetical protein